MLTSRCKRVISRADFVAISRQANEVYGRLPIKTYRATISGRRAGVTYTYTVRRLNQTRQPWLKTATGWKYNDC